MKRFSTLTLSILTVICIISCGDDSIRFMRSSTESFDAEGNLSKDDAIVDDSKQDSQKNNENDNTGYTDPEENNFSEEDLEGLEDELSQYLIHLDQVRSNTPAGGAAILQDVVGHYFSGSACFAYTNYYSQDPDTYAHEATHGLNACIRNNYNTTSEVVNGFYLLEGNAIVIKEPNVKKSKVANYIPEVLKNLDLTKRYNTYIVGQSSFENNPLYIFDEWNAYINGALESISQFRTKNFQTSAALLGGGATEFMMYATSLGLAISELDPSYFKREPKFIPLYKHLVEKTVIRILQDGASFPRVVDPSMLTYFKKFQDDPSCEKLREFVRTYMGTGWAKKILDI